jgi:four helix bundle protein
MYQQRLRCLQVLEAVARRVPSLVARLPRGNAFLADEFKRALASGILNCAEGNSRTSPRERARFFDVAIASVAEAAAAIALMLAFRGIEAEEAAEISESLRVGYAMMIRLKRAMV